jgi:hypothetical protein
LSGVDEYKVVVVVVVVVDVVCLLMVHKNK